MEQLGELGELGMAGRERMAAVVETLASLGSRAESLAEVAHDARNMVTALGLYCDLLEEPGVLAVPFAHYGNELRLVAAASRRLVEKLVALDAQPGAEAETLDASGPDAQAWGSGAGTESIAAGNGHGGGALDGDAGWRGMNPDAGMEREPVELVHNRERGDRERGVGLGPEPFLDRSREPEIEPGAGVRVLPRIDSSRQWENLFTAPVSNLAAELIANRNLLSALAGPGIAVTVDAEGGARPVRLSAEDLTRLLVNLVKNAAEAMPAPASGRGHIQIQLRERCPGNGAPQTLELRIEDNGPGIPPEALAKVFDSGFTTHARNVFANGGWPVAHRGLGLAITRSIVEASGGRVKASNREEGGARIEIELPVRTP
jgi:signal transduction histidine kinase